MGDVDAFDIWWRIGLATIGTAYRVAFRMRFDGLDRLPKGGGLIAANHVSVLDPIAIALATSAAGRPIRFVAAQEFFEHRVLDWGLRLTHQIPIKRGTRDLTALGELQDVLHAGGLAGIFPEGRVGFAQLPLRATSGTTRVALAAGAPIVPVGIWGTQERMPLGRFIWTLRRPGLAISVGDPIEVDPAASSDRPLLKATTAYVMRAIEFQMERAKRLAVA
jgi:1-acyl-sn-glycerol-3-phosphate acyltransferase